MGNYQENTVRSLALRTLCSVWPGRESPGVVGDATLPAQPNGSFQFPSVVTLGGPYISIRDLTFKQAALCPSDRMS